MKKILIPSLLLGIFTSLIDVNACTNLLVTKGASQTGSAMISYAADSHVLYGELYYTPSADHPKGSLSDIYEWDTGKHLGQIRQVEHTFSVVGNMNEHQVAIGETTFGGRSELRDTTGIMDYGSLMYVTLQRARSAREAIQIMGELVAEYGYYSLGESYSVSDKDEVWIMELIGKGPCRKGAVWVALRVPDGYVCAHANQARIRGFPLDDPENCMYTEDVVSFAREMGYYQGRDDDFSFSDAYAPVDFSGARFCEARVWSFFNQVRSGMGKYLDYAIGENLENRMPLWIKPDRKLSVKDMMAVMRDHYEGTPLDMTRDLGAGPFRLPYRWRPLTWTVNDVTYCNERAIATQQTGFSFIAESRNWLPDWIGGILWFGVDDATTTVYTPMYCGMNRIPVNFAEGNGDMLTYSPTAAFWIFNQVSNFCYLRYDVIAADVRARQSALEQEYIRESKAVDQVAATLHRTDPDLARELITDHSLRMAEHTFDEWKKLSEYLLVKYIDGNIKIERNGEFQYNGMGGKIPLDPDQPGYPDWWYKQIVDDNGELLRVKGSSH